MLIFAAAYAAIAIYKTSFALNWVITISVVGGLICRLFADLIKRKGLNL